jgi:hypothetical protein
MEGSLGLLLPPDTEHSDKYPFLIAASVDKVERTLALPYQYRTKYDQGTEGACVGFASSWMTSIHNRGFYDARWLYKEAQLVDSWPSTPPEEGTSVRAAMDILRKVGHRKILRNVAGAADTKWGILENRWARTVDEMRTAISQNKAITIGVNWYANFDRPVKKGSLNWIGQGDLGKIRGGHAVCLYGASDRYQAFRLVNNWGKEYPLVLLPYETMARLLREHGEATIVTDFPNT